MIRIVTIILFVFITGLFNCYAQLNFENQIEKKKSPKKLSIPLTELHYMNHLTCTYTLTPQE